MKILTNYIKQIKKVLNLNLTIPITNEMLDAYSEEIIIAYEDNLAPEEIASQITKTHIAVLAQF